MTCIQLLSVDRTLAEAIGEALAGRVPVELVQSLDCEKPGGEQPGGPGIVVVDRAAIPPERSVAAAVAEVVAAAGGRPVVLATDRADSDDILRAVRAGAADVMPRQSAGRDMAEVLSRLLNGALIEHGKGGRLTVVLGADQHAAAVAATDLALLRCNGGAPVLLIDCTLPTSTCEAYLDLKADYGLATAIAELERLDASLLASTLARHEPSGLMLLTFDGGTGSEPAGIAPNDIAALVRLLRACCGDVILCAGSLRHPALLRELGALADRVELVCAQSIRELETCRRLLDRVGFDAATRQRTRLLVWDHRTGVLLDKRRMAGVLDVAAAVAVPVDGVRLHNALNAGRPLALAADGSAYLQALRRVAGIARPRSELPYLRINNLRWPILHWPRFSFPQGWAQARLARLRGAMLGMVEARR